MRRSGQGLEAKATLNEWHDSDTKALKVFLGSTLSIDV